MDYEQTLFMKYQIIKTKTLIIQSMMTIFVAVINRLGQTRDSDPFLVGKISREACQIFDIKIKILFDPKCQLYSFQ